MKNKKLVIALVAFIALVGIVAGIWFATRPEPKGKPDKTGDVSDTGTSNTTGTDAEEYLYTFTVIVEHSEGTTKKFTYSTNEEYLGAFLYEEGLIVADENNPGMFHTADGEKADWNANQSYWAFYEGDQYAIQGIETTPITDGAVYKLVYTVGF